MSYAVLNRGQNRSGTSAKLVSSLRQAENGVISHYLDDKVASKLMAMGVMPGSNVILIRNAPFGGACYLKVGRQNIAVRKGEAACIALK